MTSPRLFHSPLGILPPQEPGLLKLWSQDLNLIFFDGGIGKGLVHGTKVLTSRAWVAVENLGVGHCVIGSDGRSTLVTGVFHRGVLPVYEVTFNDGVSLTVDGDHLWAVQDFNGRPSRYREEIEGRVKTSRRDSRWSDKGLWQVKETRELEKNPTRWSVPTVQPIHFDNSEVKHLIDPYLLGLLLGDGGLRHRRIVFTTADEELVAEVESRIPEGTVLKHDGRYDYRIISVTGLRGGTNILLNQLRELDLAEKGSREKFIPQEYLFASPEVRLEVLRGLMDTDGSVTPNRSSTTTEYGSVSKQLIEDVQFLVESLGGIARLSQRGVPNGFFYRLNIKMTECPFRLSRKANQWMAPTRYLPKRVIRSIKPVGQSKVTCISVDAADGLFVTEHCIVTHNTVMVIAAGCLLFEDGLIDHMLVLAHVRSKIGGQGFEKSDGWVDEIQQFSDLEVGTYLGAKRKKMLREGLPPVLVSTYETVRNDVMVVQETFSRTGKKKREKVPGTLAKALEDKKVLVVYDEITLKLGNRGSQTYKSHLYLADFLRRNAHYRAAGMTGSTIRKSPVNTFNYSRLIDPPSMPPVGVFERDYIAGFDFFGNPSKFKNLEPEGCDPNVVPLSERIAHMVTTKRKTDPDVIKYFPKRTEEFLWVDLGKKQREFYDIVHGIVLDNEDDPSGWGLLLQIAGHPMGLLRTKGRVARQIVDTVGEEGIRSLGSAKTDRLIEYFTPLVHEQGAQVVLFTFYVSMIPFIEEALAAQNMTVVTHHGERSDRDNEKAKEDFRLGKASIILSSDSGGYGLNLPEALYVANFELPSIYTDYTQRIDRNHRITSTHPSVTAVSLIARDTVDEGNARLLYRRNVDEDKLKGKGSQDHVTAQQRRALVKAGR